MRKLRLSELFTQNPNDPAGGQPSPVGGTPADGAGMDPSMGPSMGSGGDVNGVPVPPDDTNTDIDGNVLPDNGIDPEEVLAGLETHPFMDFEPMEGYDPVSIAAMDRAALTQLEKDTNGEILRIKGENKVGQYDNDELEFYRAAKDFIRKVKDRLAVLTNEDEEADEKTDTEFNPKKKRDEKPVEDKPKISENTAVIVSRKLL